MKEAGEVVEIKGSEAYLKFNRTSACAKCGACGMLAGQNDIVVSAKNSLNVCVGDKVELEFTSKNALQSTFIGYIFPLIMLFVGLGIGFAIPQTLLDSDEGFAAIMGLIFAFGSFFILKLFNPALQKKFGDTYSMVRIVGPDEEEN